MDNLTQNLRTTADPADAEKEIAAAELGKFKDVEALKRAYSALEAEFTRRCQRIRELEAANKEREADVAQPVEQPSPSPGAEKLPQSRGGDLSSLGEEVKQAVIEEYLDGIRRSAGVPIITGGSGVSATRRAPRNLREAGVLAKNYFDCKED